MKIFRIYLKPFILLILILLFIYLKLVYRKRQKVKKKLFIIDVEILLFGKYGPSNFIKAISEVLQYNTSKCNFIPHQKISPLNVNKSSDFIFIPRLMTEFIYNEWAKRHYLNKLILGPIFVPIKWNYFPQINLWNEKRFKEILKSIKGLVVHSERVRDHIVQRSNTSTMINKFMMIRACTNIKSDNVKPFNQRTIDIIFFEKYADLNKKKRRFTIIKTF